MERIQKTEQKLHRKDSLVPITKSIFSCLYFDTIFEVRESGIDFWFTYVKGEPFP